MGVALFLLRRRGVVFDAGPDLLEGQQVVLVPVPRHQLGQPMAAEFLVELLLVVDTAMFLRDNVDDPRDGVVDLLALLLVDAGLKGEM